MLKQLAAVFIACTVVAVKRLISFSCKIAFRL